MKALVLALFAFVVAPAQAQSVDRYVRMFERIAFHNELGLVHDRPTFDRWDDAPAAVRIVGADLGYGAYVEEILASLRRLTGIRAGVVGPLEPANILIYFGNADFCSFDIPSDGPARITISFTSTRHCIAEELAQTLALGNDSCIIRDSIFCESEFRETYSTADEILIRTAFDKRLRAGMPKAEAMALVPQIVRDLLKEAGLPVIERDPPSPAPNDALALP